MRATMNEADGFLILFFVNPSPRTAHPTLCDRRHARHHEMKLPAF